MSHNTKSMIKENIINEAILMNYFSGNATPLQKKLIEDWLADPENVEFYYECLNEWENNNTQFIANEALALKKVLAIKNKEENAIITESTIRLIGRRVAVAAILLVIAGTTLFLSKDAILYKSIATNYGEIKQVTLPDGSVVTLNANSEIKFSRFNFSTKTREIMLNGEADFSVIHTKSNQKFVVITNNNLAVTVLGTQFSVYNRFKKSEVVLRKGKVELNYTSVSNNQNKQLVLKPGDKFIKNDRGTDEVQLLNTEDVIAWKNHDFLFEGTSLAQVANTINENFGIRLIFQNEALANRKISGTFHAEKAEELIDAIAQVLDVNYKKRNNEIYFFE